MATARLILQGHVDDLLPESLPLDVEWALTNAVYKVERTTLANGDNTFTVPTTARMLILIPPATVSFAKKLKGAGGDTGVQIDRYLAAVVPVVTTATVIINSGGAETDSHLLIWL